MFLPQHSWNLLLSSRCNSLFCDLLQETPFCWAFPSMVNRRSDGHPCTASTVHSHRITGLPVKSSKPCWRPFWPFACMEMPAWKHWRPWYENVWQRSQLGEMEGFSIVKVTANRQPGNRKQWVARLKTSHCWVIWRRPLPALVAWHVSMSRFSWDQKIQCSADMFAPRLCWRVSKCAEVDFGFQVPNMC